MITLDRIDSGFHSIAVKDSAGDELAIAADGSIAVTDNGGSLTVDAVDLDIRDLDASQDNVAISDGTDTLAIAADGSIAVTDNGGSLTVDAVDFDIRDLSATQDNVAISDGTDTLEINADGSINAQTFPGGFSTWKVSQETVTTTEGEIVATPLTGRLSVLVQNLGNRDIYLREITGVTTANGLELPSGASFEANLDDGANLFAITGTGTADLRVVEYAA